MLEEEEAQSRALVTELDDEEFSDNDSDAGPAIGDVGNDSDGSNNVGIEHHSAHAAHAFGSSKIRRWTSWSS